MKRVLLAIAVFLSSIFITPVVEPLAAQAADAKHSPQLIMVRHRVRRHRAHKHGKHKVQKHSRRA